jgi:hypothetical protein
LSNRAETQSRNPGFQNELDKFKLVKKQPSDLSVLPNLPPNASSLTTKLLTEIKEREHIAQSEASNLPAINAGKILRPQVNIVNQDEITCNMINLIGLKSEDHINLATIKVFNYIA